MQERGKHGERAAARMLLAVERAGEHPSYQQFEAFVDARRAPAERTPIESHVAHCPRCAAELEQMRAYAPQLSKNLSGGRAAKDVVAGPIGGGAGLRAALAVLVAALAVAVVWRTTRSSGDRASAAARAPANPAATRSPSPSLSQTPPQAPSAGEFDRSVLDLVAEISPSALAAHKAGDYAGLAKLLVPMAERGHPRAQAVLGLLYAEGRGVRADARIAERLWLQAEGHVPEAKHNLRALRVREPALGKAG